MFLGVSLVFYKPLPTNISTRKWLNSHSLLTLRFPEDISFKIIYLERRGGKLRSSDMVRT
jgi:hypothetical protein